MTLNHRVLTVIACGPNERLVLEDGNTFLKDAYETLQPVALRDKDSFQLATAQSLLTIRARIAELAAGPHRTTLQIVGHGRPGELELGRSWPQPGRPCSTCIIENNSKLLALLSPSSEPLAEVRLVACKVGEEEGYPLLFSLSHLLGCDVRGSTGNVDAGMFNATTGLYEGPMTHYVRSRRDFLRTPVAMRHMTSKSALSLLCFAPPRDAPQLVFETLRFSRKLANLSEESVCMSLSGKDARKLKELCRPVSSVPDGSCVVELAFGVKATLPGEAPVSATLEVLSNRRCRLALPGCAALQGVRWDAAGFWSSPVAKAVIASYEQAWREGCLARAS